MDLTREFLESVDELKETVNQEVRAVEVRYLRGSLWDGQSRIIWFYSANRASRKRYSLALCPVKALKVREK
jgi:hypothetical protein